ncbi:proteasome lid subunit RPN8/RPN11 [Novosphingobium hassiacum]|uniref:Proteasome lid subunit RPN8/RPN11 n=1 Tax=Novosphingobium hassiacum TaxID=173676 RepID=A0A7W5ZV41_9SPHN|nr:M67 family metallopeptidase [Novosphingobium hassiacum]MBB3859648.1 proteasome lid subunit RPN8/RPN11 [Novosphingobium hassiacum]
MPPELTIAPDAYATMVTAAAAARPLEVCGLLLGTGAHIATAQVTANVACNPDRHFEIDPAALIAAHRAVRDGSGPQVVGYFHSHPNGLARPSVTDAESAARDGRVWIIVAGDTTTCWSDGPGGFEPLSYCVMQG